MSSVEQNLSYEVTNIPGMDEAGVYNNFVGEMVRESWDTELYNLVAQNAEVLVRCPWLQESVITLSEAITAYPSQLTRETLPLYMSLAYQLLANRVDEIKKPAEADESKEGELIEPEEPKQENDTETEAQTLQAKPNIHVTDKQPEKAPEDTKVLELPVSQLQVTVESQESYVLAAEAEQVAEPVPGEPEQPIRGPTKTEGPTTVSSKSAARAEAIKTSANSSAGKTNTNSLRTTVVSPAKNTVSLRSATKSVTSKTAQELELIPASADIKLNETVVVIKTSIEAKVPKPALEILEPAAEADPVVELKAALDKPAVDAGQEIEAPVLLEILDEVPAPKLAELSTLELESVAATEDAVELSDEIIEASDVELAPPILEYEPATEDRINFVEEELVTLDRLGEDTQEFYELDISSLPTWGTDVGIGETGEEQPTYYINDEPKLSADLESTGLEQLVQISLTIEEIEDTLIELSEYIEASESEMTERLNEILDKIIDVPTKLEAHVGENIIIEEQAQEKLEELFTELLDETGIDYTPGLIESLAFLTLKWHLAGEIEKLKNEEETETVPKASGPHAIIKRLLVSLSNIKKSLVHAYAIGKSAVQLYNFNFAA